MAMVKCPECGNSISDKAKSCVHCGVEVAFCSECNQMVIYDSGVCSSCGALLEGREQKRIVKAEEDGTEKEVFVKAELQLNYVQQRTLIEDIKAQPEAKELSKKRFIYALLWGIFFVLSGALVFTWVFGLLDGFVNLAAGSKSGNWITSILAFVFFLGFSIASFVMQKKSIEYMGVLKQYIATEYDNKIKELKKQVSHTGEQPPTEALSEEEKSKLVNKVGLLHILTGARYALLGIMLIIFFAVPCVESNGKSMSFWNLAMDFVDAGIANRESGVLFEYIARESSAIPVDMNGLVNVIIPLFMLFVFHIVIFCMLILNAVVGSRAKRRIAQGQAKLLTVDATFSNDKKFASEIYAASTDHGRVLFDGKEALARKLTNGGLMEVLMFGFWMFVPMLNMLIDFAGMGYTVHFAGFILSLIVWLMALACGIVKEILHNDRKLLCHISPLLEKDEAFLKAQF